MNIFTERESDIRAYARVYPVVFDKASNARMTDEDGKEYIDFFAGAGVLNFGHNNEQMIKAVVDYLQSGGILHSLDLHTTAKRDFMEAFTKTILEPRGMAHKLQFMGPTGTNSVEAALKLARRVTGREEVVAFTKGFHGMTLGALACTANQVFRNAAGVSLENVARMPFGCETPCQGCELGCGLASLDDMAAKYRESSSGIKPPAAFLVETIQAEGGVNVASAAWLEKLGAIAKEFGSLLIVDDIQVGCGRTGNYFSFDGIDIDPDIVCLAKGIGGLGTPLAMNLVKPEHDQHWKPGEHTGTFRGQNISFIAGREALKFFDNDTLMNEVHAKTEIINQALAPLAQHAGIQLRGKGMVAGLDMGDGVRARSIIDICFAQGLVVTACGSEGRVLKIIPPLTISEADLKAGLQILVEATESTLAEAA
ncbi:diaminobutyrate--2-oxoglutarate transaminase [Luminiphilus syltensis NOR5-1B]|uniref:Diaminobutyrate--2-oxoglutarate transaminase n=1 Tax=Luminiphilus syltensis NOR5-1B TaxID=565045 RepID=B8KVW7_9GAMM|nr:aspartate aminotransferase family protein [Luminiphilus syltensis]EED36045.1 diaminobutyrate--2-oxoglutarate transaminase [Luminiphilus syltensis NOR5-1B]